MTSRSTTRIRLTGMLVGILVAGFALTACASAAQPAATSTAVPAADLMPAAEGQTEYPLSLETPWGDTELSERPTRIATVGAQAVDTELVLSLGAIPITTVSNGYKQAPWLEEVAKGRIEHVLDVQSAGSYPYEQLAAADPDLIVVFGYDLSESYDRLAEIAPVLANSDVSGAGNWSGDWEPFLREIGVALDLQNQADKVIADHQAHVAEIRTAHPAFDDLEVTYSVYYGDSYGLIFQSVPGSRPAAVLQSAGLQLTDASAIFADDGKVSDELLAKIDADVVLIHDVSDLMGGSATIETLTESELFQKLSATQKERIVVTSSDTNVGWALTTGGPLGSEVALDTLVPLIAERVSQ